MPTRKLLAPLLVPSEKEQEVSSEGEGQEVVHSEERSEVVKCEVR